MKTIPLQRAFNILENCSAVIWDDQHFLSYPSVWPLDGQDDNQFLFLLCEDEGGQEFSVTFNEGSNREVKISGNTMVLVDDEGDEIDIQILNPAQDLSWFSIIGGHIKKLNKKVDSRPKPC